ncbi:MAG: helix-hairpin-helix domain-containing protein [Planctomycetes bacterium]|nr:helix-hairpin-helix domain-containing protein [Planctomycetota bacterium]
MAVAARRGGGLVHHDAPPTVPLAYTVDINAAAPAELMPLPGLGPAMAARIVDHRASHGPFTRPEDLLDVPGIGPATLDRLRPHLRPLPAGGPAP